MKECNQCGKCCTKYGGGDLDVSSEEIEMWALFNPEIYQYVQNNKIWFDPNTGDKLNNCPFLAIEPKKDKGDRDKFICNIYLDRPEDCRQYPSLIAEMLRDECEMLEPTDLKNQTRAQYKLDVLMFDSR